MPVKINVNPGDRYNQLTIIKEVERQKQHRRFLCRCSCGNETLVLLNQLRTGKTKSCGCHFTFEKDDLNCNNNLNDLKKWVVCPYCSHNIKIRDDDMNLLPIVKVRLKDEPTERKHL